MGTPVLDFRTMRARLVLAVLLVLGTVPAATQSATEEQAIQEVLKRFYDGWNAHDPETMVARASVPAGVGQ